MDLLQEVSGAKRIGISGHVRPDGDCVGACLALWQFLHKNVPQAEVKVLLEEPQEIFQYLKGFDRIISDFPEEEAFDVYFALDCNEERLGEAVKYFQAAVKTINIDHHVSNTGCGDVNLIQPEIGSTCEVLYDLIGEGYLDKDIAEALYTGMIHDTGVFQYSNTAPSTLRAAAELISYGFDFAELIEKTFYEKTYVQNQILGRALLESILFMNGKCVVSMVDKKTMSFYRAQPHDLEGIVSQLRVTKGVECAIFMYQTNDLEYKVSLRSGGSVDVAKVAEFFGGGGHARAAGATMRGTFHDIVNNLSDRINEQMKGKQ